LDSSSIGPLLGGSDASRSGSRTPSRSVAGIPAPGVSISRHFEIDSIGGAGFGRRGLLQGQDSSPLRECLQQGSSAASSIGGSRSGCSTPERRRPPPTKKPNHYSQDYAPSASSSASAPPGAPDLFGTAAASSGSRRPPNGYRAAQPDSSQARTCLLHHDAKSPSQLKDAAAALQREEVQVFGISRRGGRRVADSSLAQSSLQHRNHASTPNLTRPGLSHRSAGSDRSRTPDGSVCNDGVDQDFIAVGITKRAGRRIHDSTGMASRLQCDPALDAALERRSPSGAPSRSITPRRSRLRNISREVEAAAGPHILDETNPSCRRLRSRSYEASQKMSDSWTVGRTNQSPQRRFSRGLLESEDRLNMIESLDGAAGHPTEAPDGFEGQSSTRMALETVADDHTARGSLAFSAEMDRSHPCDSDVLRQEMNFGPRRRTALSSARGVPSDAAGSHSGVLHVAAALVAEASESNEPAIRRPSQQRQRPGSFHSASAAAPPGRSGSLNQRPHTPESRSRGSSFDVRWDRDRSWSPQPSGVGATFTSGAVLHDSTAFVNAMGLRNCRKEVASAAAEWMPSQELPQAAPHASHLAWTRRPNSYAAPAGPATPAGPSRGFHIQEAAAKSKELSGSGAAHVMTGGSWAWHRVAPDLEDSPHGTQSRRSADLHVCEGFGGYVPGARRRHFDNAGQSKVLANDYEKENTVDIHTYKVRKPQKEINAPSETWMRWGEGYQECSPWIPESRLLSRSPTPTPKDVAGLASRRTKNGSLEFLTRPDLPKHVIEASRFANWYAQNPSKLCEEDIVRPMRPWPAALPPKKAASVPAPPGQPQPDG